MMSKLEQELHNRLVAECLTNGMVQEYRFHTVRKWRFDFAWPSKMLAVELDGGTWISGRHNTGIGIDSDCEKYNAATLDGWRVLRFTYKHIKNGENNGEAIRIIRAMLEK